jgi:rhodanese-related sulfurtransferase
MSYVSKYQVFTLFVMLIMIHCVNAMTIASLNDRISSNDRITIIDIRSTEHYQKSHIPGAISIPASLCANKKLPQFGHVVVYGDGLNQLILKQAVSALNKKEGIRAEALEDGFSQWTANNYPITVQSGMIREELPYITLHDFEKIVKLRTDILLLDIRNQKHRKRSMSDLQQRYPNIPVVASPFSQNQKRVQPDQLLFVLIDSGDGASEKMAHRMKSAGMKHFVILTGGEQSFHSPTSHIH